MPIKTASLHGSPYIGIFCSVTDDVALVPHHTPHTEQKKIGEALEVNVIPCTVAESQLIGVMAKGLGKKIAVAYTTTDEEIRALEKHGLEIYRVHEMTAIGNLVCVQENGGIASPMIPHEEVARLQDFWNVKFHRKIVAQSEIAGSCIVATGRGFLSHPKTDPEEM